MRSIYALSIYICLLTLCATTMAKKRGRIRHPHNMFSGKRGFLWNHSDEDKIGDTYRGHPDQLKGNFAQDWRVTAGDETGRFLARLMKEKQGLPGKSAPNQYESSPLESDDWYPPENLLYRNI